MSIDYSAYTFFGMKIGNYPELSEEDYEFYGNPDKDYPDGFGYLTLGSWMGGGPEISVWLTYGRVYGGDIRYREDDDILGGIRIDQRVDQEWAKFAFAEVCEKYGWNYSEPGWYVGMSIS